MSSLPERSSSPLRSSSLHFGGFLLRQGQTSLGDRDEFDSGILFPSSGFRRAEFRPRVGRDGGAVSGASREMVIRPFIDAPSSTLRAAAVILPLNVGLALKAQRAPHRNVTLDKVVDTRMRSRKVTFDTAPVDAQHLRGCDVTLNAAPRQHGYSAPGRRR